MSLSQLLDLPDWPEVDFAEFGPVERQPLSKIQRLTARFLGRNYLAIPHVTQQDEVDVTTFEARRAAWNTARPEAKITPMAPLAKAVVAALKRYPKFNVSLERDGVTLVLKHYFNVGIAIDSPQGLLVGVVREADAKTISQIGAEISTLAEKARTKGLSMPEMSGGSMTISSLGHIGGTGFTPIINAPEVAVLGVSRTQLRPLPDQDGQLTWHKMLPLSLSYDHRVINGADAARFVITIGEELAAIEDFA